MSVYAVVDLEMCPVTAEEAEGRYDWYSEIIQIGAAVLSEDGEITDRFMTYVRPAYGHIPKNITELTGITPSQVEDAPDARTALERFAAWVPEGAVFAAWSDSDRAQLAGETAAKQIRIPALDRLLETTVDCQEIFARKMKADKSYRLSEALVIADIDYDENLHDALSDAVNTAMLLIRMNREDELQLSPYYHSSEEKIETVYNPLADLLKGFVVRDD